MPDVHVYVNRPAEREGAGMDDLEAAITKLEHVSHVDINEPGNVVAVTYEGGEGEREEIERAVEGAGFGISRISVRSDFSENSKLWDI